MPHLNLDDHEATELLEKLLEHDQAIESLEGKIAAAKDELADLKTELADEQAKRAKLSFEIRHPQPLLSGKS